jgi:hypothetical protein
MNTADRQIADILAKYGEPFEGNVWRVQGTAVIYHKALERIAAVAAIRFEEPTIVRAERDEAVILVKGYILDGSRAADRGPRFEWSIGEALLTDGTRPGNYRVSGRQAAYVYAMAEKRAKDRVILKLIELHGLVYSEEEADEFKDARPAADAGSGEAASAGAGALTSSLGAPNQQPADASPIDKLVFALEQCVSVETFEMRRKSQAFQNEVDHLTTPQRDELLAFIRRRRAQLRRQEGGGDAASPAVEAMKADALKAADRKGGDLAKRAGVLCGDPEFIAFVLGNDREASPAGFLREWCNVTSRADLDHDVEAAGRFEHLLDAFESYKRMRTAA